MPSKIPTLFPHIPFSAMSSVILLFVFSCITPFFTLAFVISLFAWTSVVPFLTISLVTPLLAVSSVTIASIILIMT